MLLLLAVCVIPFALGQRPVSGSSSDESNGGTESRPQLPTTLSDSDGKSIDSLEVPQTPPPQQSPGALYTQYNNPATEPPLGIGSQQFEPAYSALSDQVADDFTLIGSSSWIERVSVKGEYSAGGGPVSSFNIYFYTNAAGRPGTLITALTNRPYTVNPPDFFSISFGPVILGPGTYWVSVQAVMDQAHGQWFWHNCMSQYNLGAVWQNPSDGYGTGCVAWNRKNACMPDQVWPDQIFGLYGEYFPTPTATATSAAIATATGSPTPTVTATATFTPAATATVTATAAVTPTQPPTPSPTPTAAATPCTVLYDQTDNAGGGGVVSQNFESSNNIYDAQAADDFVVPSMQNWTLQQIKVNGNYFNGSGPAASANVTLYFDSGGFPGDVVSGGPFNNLLISDASGNLTIPLPTNLVLTSGTYWISVQPNLDFNPFGEWAWSDRIATSSSAAAWQNPGGGFATSCSLYGRRGANCGIDPTAPDQIFQILGCPVTTSQITISGGVFYCSNPVPGPVANVEVTVSGSAQGMSSSDSSGNYLFSLPSSGTYTVTPAKAALSPGSGINTTDVVAIQRHFLNLGTPLSGCRLMAADVNIDALINTVDVIAVQRFYLGFTTGTANTGKYQFSPTTRTYSGVVNNQPNQNYDALVLGDAAMPFVQ